MSDLNQRYGIGNPPVETTLSTTISQLQADIKRHHLLEDTQQQVIKDLQADLATNAAMLAKQHDRNMELETELVRVKANHDIVIGKYNQVFEENERLRQAGEDGK